MNACQKKYHLGLLKVTLGFVFGALACTLQAELSEAEWRAKSVAAYPELGVVNSTFNKAFLNQVAILRNKNPKFFADASWSYKLAGEVSKLLQKERRSTVPFVRSQKLMERCMDAIQRKRSEDSAFAKQSGWIVENSIPVKMRVKALLLAREFDPELNLMLHSFFEELLNDSGPYSQENKLWLKAFISAKPLHGPVAALFEREVSAFIISLLSATNDEPFIISWLRGDDGPFLDGMPASEDLKSSILDRVVHSNCLVGAVQLSKSKLVEEVLLKSVTSRTVGLLENFIIQDWPASVLLKSLPKSQEMKQGTKEWEDYQTLLKKTTEGLMKAKRSANPAFISVHPPGLFVKFLLWKNINGPQDQEPSIWMKDVQKQIRGYPDTHVRELERILPVLETFLADIKKEN